MNKHFLLLLSLSAANAAVGKTILARLKRDVDQAAAPLWIDAHGVGVFMTTTLPAWKAWQATLTDLPLDRDVRILIRDAVLLEIGPGWVAEPTSKAGAWLNARFPRH